jgi:cell wall-associated NlpC family hydrolase
MTLKQQILYTLKAIATVCWLLVKNILLLIKRGFSYVYLHRVQIMQHKVTLPVLVVLSVFWTGLSAFKQVSKDTNDIAAQETLLTEDTTLIPASYVHLTGSNDADVSEDAGKGQPFHDTRLVAHIMDWVGTPHRDNTKSKNGTDCSGFVQAVFMDAHGIELSRSSADMYNNDVNKISKRQLQEGDLVFFNTFGSGISHVGIYLKEGKFAHTSSSKGVTVSSLDERYYQKNYRGAGRVKSSKHTE